MNFFIKYTKNQNLQEIKKSSCGFKNGTKLIQLFYWDMKLSFGTVKVRIQDFPMTLCQSIVEKITLEMPGIEPGAFHMQSERATTALHPLLILKVKNLLKFFFYKYKKKNVRQQIFALDKRSCMGPKKQHSQSKLLCFVSTIRDSSSKLDLIL